MIRGGDAIGHLGPGHLERDIPLHPAGPDPTFARPKGPLEPGIVVALGGPDVDVVAMTNAPDRDERAEASVRAT